MLRFSLATTLLLSAFSSFPYQADAFQDDAIRNGSSKKESSKRDSEKKDSQSTQFLKVSKSDDGDLKALETAVTRYVQKESGIIVDLVGVVHIGEADYYENLNKLFTDYEVVLYELVAPDGIDVANDLKSRPANPISMLQQSARNLLGLESQLQKIDYGKENFVHADMTPEEMMQAMKARGQTPMTLALESMVQALSQNSNLADQVESGEGVSMEQILEALSDPLQAKRLMARQFADPDTLEKGLGQSLNQLLVDDRNSEAMKVLSEQMDEGKKKIAIFYGAAHMPDFEERLTDQLGFEQKVQGWLTAWDLTANHSPVKDPAMSLLMQLLKELEK